MQLSWGLVWPIACMKELAILNIFSHQSMGKYWNQPHTCCIFHILPCGHTMGRLTHWVGYETNIITASSNNNKSKYGKNQKNKIVSVTCGSHYIHVQLYMLCKLVSGILPPSDFPVLLCIWFPCSSCLFISHSFTTTHEMPYRILCYLIVQSLPFCEPAEKKPMLCITLLSKHSRTKGYMPQLITFWTYINNITGVRPVASLQS